MLNLKRLSGTPYILGSTKYDLKLAEGRSLSIVKFPNNTYSVKSTDNLGRVRNVDNLTESDVNKKLKRLKV